jgi:hypothetical protein
MQLLLLDLVKEFLGKVILYMASTAAAAKMAQSIPCLALALIQTERRI